MKNILRNKKGFTLLEILVTVGIVGVLSAVAIPAYNQYKGSVTRTAMKSDTGNIAKSYLAYNAMNGDYCANLKDVGIQIEDKRNYNKQGWLGFSNTTCTPSIPAADIIVDGGGGTCTNHQTITGTNTNPQPTSQSACTTAPAGGGTAGTWSTGGLISILPTTDCELAPDQFVTGSYSNVMDIDYAYFTNDDGKVHEDLGSPGDCSNVPATW